MIAIPRLYPILDTAVLERRRFPLLEAARVMLESGVHLLQWRCKGVIGRAQLEEVDRLVALCQRHGALLVVNDRADLAMMAGAGGVHVGQDDLTPEEVRSIAGPRIVLGYSTHNPAQFDAALGQPVDYVALGPIFGTATKENPDPEVGLATLSACAGRSKRPVVAIGGITRSNAASVFAAGAASVAVIGDLIPDPCNAGSLRRRLGEWTELL